jgi:hypothetical protein
MATDSLLSTPRNTVPNVPRPSSSRNSICATRAGERRARVCCRDSYLSILDDAVQIDEQRRQTRLRSACVCVCVANASQYVRVSHL